VYRSILGPIYGSEKENWRILNYNKIYANGLKKTLQQRQ
jgi:hypothetical protein